MSLEGSVQHYPTHLDAAWVPISFNTSGDQTIVAGAAGQRVYVYSIILSAASQVNLIFKDGTTAKSGAMPISSMTIDMEDKPFITSSGNAFVINSSGNIAVGGMALVLQG